MGLFDFEHALLLSAPAVLAFIVFGLTRRLALRTMVLILALFGYLLVVSKYTFFPLLIGGTGGASSMAVLWRSANFVPFDGLEVGSRQFFGNIALGVPFGLLLPALARWERRPWPALASCLAFGVAIELVQFGLGAARLIRFRSLDANDAILNAVGRRWATHG